MADASKIEWTDATWNIITGCDVVSPGCANCYAMRLAGTRLKHHPSRIGLTNPSKAGPVWNGEVRFNEQWLDQPYRWRNPRLIFVCAHGDLFHKKVPDEWLDRIFATMTQCPQHIFQVLTKRPERMRDYCKRVWEARKGMKPAIEGWANGKRYVLGPWKFHDETEWSGWPLPNVWLGVSAEDQQRADERIPILLDTPAAVRWVSVEPLLGPISLERLIPLDGGGRREFYLTGEWIECTAHARSGRASRLDWIVAGGESQPGARPMHPDWARSIRDQCKAAGVAFHFKQWGEFGPCELEPPHAPHRPRYSVILSDGRHLERGHTLDHPENRTGEIIARFGKKRAGRLLDGIEHNDFPEITR